MEPVITNGLFGVGKHDEEKDYSDFNMQKVLWFTLGAEEYAIKVDDVQSVQDEYVLTPVPNTPRFALGVINLRGTIIPVVDLKKLFQMPVDGDEKGMVVVLEVTDLNNMRVGIVVDKVNGVLDINFSLETAGDADRARAESVNHGVDVNSTKLQPPPPSLSGLGAEYVIGMHRLAGGSVLIVVNMVKIISIAKEMISKYS